MKGNGYSNDTTTPEGRLLQLQTWCSASFASQSVIDKFLKSARGDLDGKTPADCAKTSLSGLECAKKSMKNYKSELKND